MPTFSWFTNSLNPFGFGRAITTFFSVRPHRDKYDYEARIYPLDILQNYISDESKEKVSYDHLKDEDKNFIKITPSYKKPPNELEEPVVQTTYQPKQLTSNQKFNYGLLHKTKPYIHANKSEAFYSTAGEFIHFAVAVQVWYIGKSNIEIISSFDGNEDLTDECYKHALRFLINYSWLGPRAHDIVCTMAQYILDFKPDVTKIVIENHVEDKTGDKSPDYILVCESIWKTEIWRTDLKTFHHRKSGDAMSTMNGLTMYDSVFFMSLSFKSRTEPTFTIGHYAYNAPKSSQIDHEYKVLDDWAKPGVSEPFFRIHNFIRHDNVAYTFAGNIIHYLMPYIIMSCHDLKKSGYECYSKSTMDRENTDFKKDRYRIFLPLLNCTIAKDASKTSLTKFGNQIYDKLIDLMKEYGTTMEVEWKTKWVDETATLGSLAQTRADMIISPKQTKKHPLGNKVGIIVQFTFPLKNAVINKKYPNVEYIKRVAVKDPANTKEKINKAKIQFWAEKDLGNPKFDGRKSFKAKPPTRGFIQDHRLDNSDRPMPPNSKRRKGG